MYNYKKPLPTSLRVNKWEIGENMEAKIRRIIANKEQVKDNVELMYSDVTTGVPPQFNIRSDKFETAINALDDNAKKAAMQTQSVGALAKVNMEKEAQGETPQTPQEGTSD